MVNTEALTERSLRHYELGRLRMATRIALVLGPLAAVCLLQPTGRETTACCAALLFAASVWLRFRNRAGVESVTTGLIAGAVPLAALLLLARLDPGCATAGLVSYCTGISLVAGAVAGAVVARRERVRAPLSGNWLFPVAIALLTAGLACARLGPASLAGVTVGMLVVHASARGRQAAE